MESVNIKNGAAGLVLVGMPGAGKSTVGVLLAKALGLDFIDTDVAIQVREGKTLQQILDESDYLNLRRIEQEVLLSTDCRGKVVATGGSAVYSDPGMTHLKQNSTVLFLDVSLEALKKRISNYQTRGIARRPDQSFQSLFDERHALYQRWADIRIDCDRLDIEGVLTQAIDSLNPSQEP